MKLLTMLSLVAVAVPLIRAEELGVTFYEAPAPIKGVVWDVPAPSIEDIAPEDLQHPPANRPPRAQEQRFWQVSLSGGADSDEMLMFVACKKTVSYLAEGEDISQSRLSIVDESSGGFRKAKVLKAGAAPEDFREIARRLKGLNFTTNAIYQIGISYESAARIDGCNPFSKSEYYGKTAVERKLFMSTDGKLFCNLNLVRTDSKKAPMCLGLWVFSLSDKKGEEIVERSLWRMGENERVYRHTVIDANGDVDIYVGYEDIQTSFKLSKHSLLTAFHSLRGPDNSLGDCPHSR